MHVKLTLHEGCYRSMSDCDSISQIVRLISLTEEEEEAIRSVIEEELRLQQDEDDRLKSVIWH